MTHRDYIIAAINHEQTDRVPYVLSFEGGTDKELDQYLGSTEWRQQIQHWMRTVAGVDAVTEKPIDATFARDAFGSLWRMDRLPWHLEKPVFENASFEGVEWPTIDKFDTWIEDDIEGPQERFTVIQNGWGIFEQSWRARGFENMLMDCVAEEDFYTELLDKLTDLRLEMISLMKGIPADAVMFGDDWGDQRGIIIGPERWRKFLKPRWARVFEAVHAQGRYAMCHSCGSVAEIIPDLIEIGLDVLESVQPEPAGMESLELKQKYGDKITFWGCLGSQSTVAFGTPEEIKARVQLLCSEMGKGGGYILAPAKPIQPGTPPENALAVVEAFSANNL